MNLDECYASRTTQLKVQTQYRKSLICTLYLLAFHNRTEPKKHAECISSFASSESKTQQEMCFTCHLTRKYVAFWAILQIESLVTPPTVGLGVFRKTKSS